MRGSSVRGSRAVEVQELGRLLDAALDLLRRANGNSDM